ncbi:hypothetical protein [Amnibacterium flavum]|uniref:Uncharacterized protein n=1 Tax=Amnibacterium flavum TaxID=2173173 RepID=A0A2V1HU72_9MICO|nr:hypothetical protein [Amnibacterium flavum]PVZ95851.1 hypothetical protein DDQ50_05145 [Amnibacterium flavum]
MDPDPQSAPVQLLDARFDADASAIVVSAVIPDRVAEGSCLLTITSAFGVDGVTAPAVPDASVTYCASVTVPVASASEGPWSFELRYTDDTSSGSIAGTVDSR